MTVKCAAQDQSTFTCDSQPFNESFIFPLDKYFPVASLVLHQRKTFYFRTSPDELLRWNNGRRSRLTRGEELGKNLLTPQVRFVSKILELLRFDRVLKLKIREFELVLNFSDPAVLARITRNHLDSCNRDSVLRASRVLLKARGIAHVEK